VSLAIESALTSNATTTAVGTSLAFGFFGKRRHDGDRAEAPSDAATAKRAVAVVAVADGPLAEPSAAPAPVAVSAGPPDREAGMPRWRRPSLILARKADGHQGRIARQSFDHGAVGALDGRERRLIRYNVVRLLDAPDELRGREVALVDQGDEVQLLEKHGVFWLVLCPDGRQGWTHQMTLGAVVGEPRNSMAPAGTMARAADARMTGDGVDGVEDAEDVDGDVLAAYLASRRRG
jgi:hypothetical protein